MIEFILGLLFGIVFGRNNEAKPESLPQRPMTKEESYSMAFVIMTIPATAIIVFFILGVRA
jgi:hypothetical protein